MWKILLFFVFFVCKKVDHIQACYFILKYIETCSWIKIPEAFMLKVFFTIIDRYTDWFIEV